MEKWDRNIRTVTKKAGKHPQESYATVVHAIQSEWIFFKARQKIQDKRLREWKNLRETFLLNLSFGESKNLPPIVGAPSKFPVNKSGLGLQNPVTSSAEKYTSLLCVRHELIGAVTGERGFHRLSYLVG